jgi:hypothetical protein
MFRSTPAAKSGSVDSAKRVVLSLQLDGFP